MMLTALFLALVLPQAAPADAPSPAPAAAMVAKAKPAADPMECREQVMTGSHFSSRTCLHRSEWMRLHDASVEALSERGRDRQPGLRPN